MEPARPLTSSADQQSARRPISDLLVAIAATSGATLIAAVLGVGTTKIIATGAGEDGIAIVGMYRALTAFVLAVVSLGSTEVIMQRVSSARSNGDMRPVLGGVTALFLLQCVAILILAAAATFVASHVWGDRLPYIGLVISLSVGVLSLQTSQIVLGGLMQVRATSFVIVITSALTLATAYPLLALGRLGLAFMIGATCFAGGALAWIFIVRSAQFVPGPDFSRVREMLALRSGLPLLPLAITFVELAIQSLVENHYGKRSLGVLNAAFLLQTSSLSMLTASFRPYFVPKLATLDRRGQQVLASNTVRVLLIPLVCGGSLLLLFGEELLAAFFAKGFVTAEPLLAILAISMLTELLAWIASMYLIQQACFGQFATVFLINTFARLVLTFALSRFDLDLRTIALAHTGCYAFAASGYLAFSRQRLGMFLFDRSAMIWIGIAALALAGLYMLADAPRFERFLLEAGVLAVCCAVGLVIYRSQRRPVRMA